MMQSELDDTKKTFYIFRSPAGFSLAEVLAALVIGSMVLVAVLGIYSRAQNSAAAITRRLDSTSLPSEVLQRIAEDLDRAVAPGSDTKITIENKFQNGFSTARLTILRTIRDSKNRNQTFEEIIWQGSYDSDANSLILYRSYSGAGLEDKLLDEQRQGWEKAYPFVPVCAGVTFFKIQALKGENLQDKWTSDSLPNGIVVTLSLARPFKTLTGALEVPDAKKFIRTIAVNRTRKIKFILVKKMNKEDRSNEESISRPIE